MDRKAWRCFWSGAVTVGIMALLDIGLALTFVGVVYLIGFFCWGPLWFRKKEP